MLVVHHPGPVTRAKGTSISFNCGGKVAGTTLADAVVDGTTLRIRVPDAAIPDFVAAGEELASIWIETRNSQGPANVLETATTREAFPLR